MSMGQQKPRGEEQISGRKMAQFVGSPGSIYAVLLKSSPAGKKSDLASAK
jgi:hypothetical protein